MDANIYLIRLYLKQFEIVKSIKDIYAQGSKLIKKLLYYSKLEVDKFVKELVKIDLHVYDDTLYRGLPLFFTHYNFDYNPQDTVLTFDYPTYLHLTNKQGIECFLEYFEFVKIENNSIELLIYNTFNDLIILLQLDSTLSNYLYMVLKEIIAEFENNYLLKRLTSELSVLI